MLHKRILKPGDALDDAFKVRLEVFVDEQGFSRELETDDVDPAATHIVFYDLDKPVATARAFQDREKPDEYILGRIAVLKSYRGTGLGCGLMSDMEDAVKKAGALSVKLGAQCRVQQFYEKCGYVAYGDIYYDEYCPHIYMRKAL